MKENKLNSWEEFESTFPKEESKIKSLKESGEHTGIYISDLLYRGHSRAKWKLETTLERYSKKEFSWKKYREILGSVEPSVSSFFGQNHDLSNSEKSRDVPPAYEFMAHVRHHGFPSPLLDWTKSPYIAAYFAFSDADTKEDVSIYSFREYLTHGKSFSKRKPHIRCLGPYIKTHKRHHLQQCQYTICFKEPEENSPIYCPHESNTFLDEQDILTKYCLPGSEKEKVLKKLDLMNINAFSLFGNEESLMETLAFREINR